MLLDKDDNKVQCMLNKCVRVLNFRQLKLKKDNQDYSSKT